jgi:tRNA(Ile)-lysidine synthase
VAQTISKYRMLRPGERVAVAVSGGPDSVAMLRALVELREQLGILLSVAHVNHGLRGPESDADEAFTRELAGSLGLDCWVQRAALANGNLEQEGRRIRLHWFRRLVEEKRVDKIATGHTRTDQAETVLFRFLRGAGTAGLAGIHPVLDDHIVRPLIEIDRADVLAYLQSAGHAWREDSSNRNLELARNRLRHELLPRLEREGNPGLSARLAQMADWARDEERYWQQQVQDLALRYLREEDQVVYLEAPALATLPAAVERRLLRHAVERVKGDLLGIEFGHIEQVRALLAAEDGHGRVQLPGVDVFRSFDQVRLAPVSEPQERNYSVPLPGPGTYDIPHTQKRLVLELRETGGQDRRYNEESGCLDWEQVPRPLWLRNWRPGDHYQPVGWSGQEKLKTLFQQRRVPLWERRYWPVVASEWEVIWARGFGAASALAAGPGTRMVLEITETESGKPGSSVYRSGAEEVREFYR